MDIGFYCVVGGIFAIMIYGVIMDIKHKKNPPKPGYFRYQVITEEDENNERLRR